MLQDIIVYIIVGAAFIYCILGLFRHFRASGKGVNKCASCTAECPLKNLKSAQQSAGACSSCGTSKPARPNAKTCSHYRQAAKHKAESPSHKARLQ
ncbi:hypothetical protein [Alloprevotella tannerae]|uniref:hypothetical protein n=1 Tax=Alloprevotella tannerae TaxID=76122 RepID=UPI003C6F9A9D